MRWEDERYVRVYIRDTTDWVALGWEAQALLVLTMRKMDRAGILDLGKSRVRGLAALVAMPVEVVERALPVLLEDGCFVLNGSTLVMPNFIEAQEAAQSDKHRKAESRARARDRAAASGHEASQNVTECPEPVTGGHAASREVTPYCAVPCRAEPEAAAAARARARDGAISKTGPGVAEAASPPPAAEAAPGPTSTQLPQAQLAAPLAPALPSGATEEALPPPSAEQASDLRPGTESPEARSGMGPGAAPGNIPTPAAVGSLSEAATPDHQVDEEPPRRPLRLIDTTDLGPLGAEWRADMEQASGWKIVTAAVGRRDAFKAGLEAALEALGLERAVAGCVRIVERRKGQGLGPPGSWAFFLPALEELAAGADLMPPPRRNAAFREQASHQDPLPGPDLFSRERWQPLLDRLTPALREQLCAEAERMVTAVESEGLWTSARNAKLEEVEGYLREKYERRAGAAGGA